MPSARARRRRERRREQRERAERVRHHRRQRLRRIAEIGLHRGARGARARVPAWARGERLAGALDRQQRATPPPWAAPPDATPPPPEVDLDAIFGRAVPTSAERAARTAAELEAKRRKRREQSEIEFVLTAAEDLSDAAGGAAAGAETPSGGDEGRLARARSTRPVTVTNDTFGNLARHYAKYNGMPGRERELELVQRVDGDDDALHVVLVPARHARRRRAEPRAVRRPLRAAPPGPADAGGQPARERAGAAAPGLVRGAARISGRAAARPSGARSSDVCVRAT